MQVSGVYAVYNPDKTITNKVLTTTSSLSKESLEKQNEQSDEPIANGKLEVALFGHELSKKEFLQSLIRFIGMPMLVHGYY
ncbi:hypothetical protein AAHB63_15600 [Bacillus thuringiensis]